MVDKVLVNLLRFAFPSILVHSLSTKRRGLMRNCDDLALRYKVIQSILKAMPSQS